MNNQIIDFMRSIKNPKQTVINMMKNNSNPIITNLVQMAEKGDYEGVEKFTRNYFKEQGRDFDKELAELKKFMENS